MKLTVGLPSETCSSALLLETFGLRSGGPRSGALARFMSRLHARLLALPCSAVNGLRPRLPRMTLCSHSAPHSGALVFISRRSVCFKQSDGNRRRFRAGAGDGSTGSTRDVKSVGR